MTASWSSIWQRADQVTSIGGAPDTLVQKNFEHLDASGLGSSVNATGSASANIIIGSNGDDIINGGAGSDVLNGGAGDDTLNGGNGSDVILIENASEHGVGEMINGDAGADVIRFTSVIGGEELTLSAGVTVESVVIANAAGVTSGTTALDVDASAVVSNGLTLIGNAGANILTGTILNDVVSGKAGNDTLDGGGGNDTMSGGTGNDTYIVDATADVATEGFAAGTDMVYSSITYTLGLNVENLTLAGSDSINATGNGLNNILVGNHGNNQLSGLAGSDQLIGGAGQDTVTGGTENDRIEMLVGVGDVDHADGGAGSDTLALVGVVDGDGIVVVNLAAGDQVTSIGGAPDTLVQKNFEHLDASGLGSSVNATGSASANIIIGSNGDDIINGGAGSDVLKGGAGDDTMIGGLGIDNLQGGTGDDLFLIGSTLEFAVGEVIAGGDGANTLRYTGNAAATLTLTNLVTNIEQVEIADAAGDPTGIAAINVNAAAVANGLTILGNNGANVLTGTSQADTLIGNGDNDTLSGGAGGDILNGGDGNDIFIWDPADTSVGGGAGTDTLRIDGSGVHVDLTAVPDEVITDIEVINLTGSGNNLLTLASSDVLAISPTTDTLRVDGNGGDMVSAGLGWVPTQNIVIGAQTYVEYTKDGVLLQVDTDIDRSGIGAISLSTLTGVNGFKLSGAAAGDHSGYSVSAAGDVNGDGYDDLIVGAPDADSNGLTSGASYVVFGQASGFAANINLSILNGTGGFKLSGIEANDQSGFSVSGAGDVNGDGFSDLIIGAPIANIGHGESYVVFGKAGGFGSNINLSSLDGITGFKLSGFEDADYIGFSVSSAGDVNGDGFDDIVVGSPGGGSIHPKLGGFRQGGWISRSYCRVRSERGGWLWALVENFRDSIWPECAAQVTSTATALTI